MTKLKSKTIRWTFKDNTFIEQTMFTDGKLIGYITNESPQKLCWSKLPDDTSWTSTSGGVIDGHGGF